MPICNFLPGTCVLYPNKIGKEVYFYRESLLMTEREYNECVTEFSDNVYRFILKNLKHEEDARDVGQTAFEKLWRNRAEVNPGKSKSYLFTVAYHQMIDHLRKNKRVLLRES